MFWFLIIVGIAVALNEIQKRNKRIEELEYELSELRRQNTPELDVHVHEIQPDLDAWGSVPRDE